MAAYFQLTRKSDPDAGPVPLTVLDEEICEARGATPDPVRYHDYWFDSIGWRQATGMSWDEIRKSFALQKMEADERDDGADYAALMQRLSEITDWLEERFTVRAWRQ